MSKKEGRKKSKQASKRKDNKTKEHRKGVVTWEVGGKERGLIRFTVQLKHELQPQFLKTWDTAEL